MITRPMVDETRHRKPIQERLLLTGGRIEYIWQPVPNQLHHNPQPMVDTFIPRVFQFKFPRKAPDEHQRITRGIPEEHQRSARGVPEEDQRNTRGAPEEHQRSSR